MSRFSNYLDEIKEREEIGLSPKPIDNGDLLEEIITNILDIKRKYHSQSLNFFIYNVLPGTTAASNAKSKFLLRYEPRDNSQPLNKTQRD